MNQKNPVEVLFSFMAIALGLVSWITIFFVPLNLLLIFFFLGLFAFIAAYEYLS
jgi:hypothetical protein